MSEPVGAKEARALFDTFDKWQQLDEAKKPTFFLARIFVNIANFFKGKVYEAQAKQQLRAFEGVEIRLPGLPTTFEEAQMYGGFLRNYPFLADLHEPDKPWSEAWQKFAGKLKPIARAEARAKRELTTASTSRQALHAAAILNTKGDWETAIRRMGELVTEARPGRWNELGDLSKELGGFEPGKAAKTRIDTLLGLRGQEVDLARQRRIRHDEYMTQQRAVGGGRGSFQHQYRIAVTNAEKAEQDLRTLVEPQLARLQELPESLQGFFRAQLEQAKGDPLEAVNEMFALNQEVLVKRASPAEIVLETAPQHLKGWVKPYCDDLSKDPKQLAIRMGLELGKPSQAEGMTVVQVVDYRKQWVEYSGPNPVGLSISDVKKGEEILSAVQEGLKGYPALAAKRDEAVAHRDKAEVVLNEAEAELAARKKLEEAADQALAEHRGKMRSVALS